MPSPHLNTELLDAVAVVRLTRPLKRNALNDGLITDLHHAFDHLPPTVRAVVVHGEGEHFCAGLDLSELQERDAGQGMMHSRFWHRALDAMQFGPVPVIAALHGAVVGGGLELASATSGWPTKARFMPCPRARAAFLSVARGQCAFPS